jgi:hypothetical protein
VDVGTLAVLDALARVDLAEAGAFAADERSGRQARNLLYAFAEYHIERRIKSLGLARTLSR